MTQTILLFKKAIFHYLEEDVKVEEEEECMWLDNVDTELDEEMLKAKQAITFTIYRKLIPKRLYPLSI